MEARSEYWNEVGEEIRNVSVAYGAGEGIGGFHDVESGSEHSNKAVEAEYVGERKVAANY